MTVQDITINGTHCAACARIITRDLAKQGVTVQRIDIKTGKTTIEHANVPKSRIADALARHGYAIAGARDNASKAAAPGTSVERQIITAGLISLAFLLLAQALFVRYIAPKFPTWSPQYAAPLLLLAVAIGVNLIAIWHQRAYRREVSCMTGMMVGMTVGMSTGFMVGAVAGLLNGMFWGAIIGILLGIPAGVYAGRCCGIMGAMEGIMAGFMGGTMGAMVAAMASVFQLRLGIDPTDLPLLILSGLLLVALSVITRKLFEKWEEMRANELRWADDVVKLITINMDLQTFATTVENRTLDEERKRISREIHDTVGYTLTTLKVLFEAAKGLLRQDPAQLEPLINQGLDYTRNSMEEIRVAMRELRQSELPARTGLHLVVKLVDNFRSVTHMSIALEFAGTRQSYGHEIDEFLYKGVQENLTNAYRHGKATAVTIFLQESQGELALMVRDNGQSTRNFMKGIGMRGMEERAAALGGTVEFTGSDYGFNVTARIPVPKGEDI